MNLSSCRSTCGSCLQIYLDENITKGYRGYLGNCLYTEGGKKFMSAHAHNTEWGFTVVHLFTCPNYVTRGSQMLAGDIPNPSLSLG